MPRILADLAEDDIKWLDARAAEQGKSRAAVLREAVSAYRTEGSADWIARGFGVWKDRVAMTDSIVWQRRERANWNRGDAAPHAGPDAGPENAAADGRGDNG